MLKIPYPTEISPWYIHYEQNLRLQISLGLLTLYCKPYSLISCSASSNLFLAINFISLLKTTITRSIILHLSQEHKNIWHSILMFVSVDNKMKMLFNSNFAIISKPLSKRKSDYLCNTNRHTRHNTSWGQNYYWYQRYNCYCGTPIIIRSHYNNVIIAYLMDSDKDVVN